MNAFFNDESIKQKYLNRVKAHHAADEIIKGQYWENGKGCAVGCTIHNSDHKQYEVELGIPLWLARLEDRIFEGMSNEKAKEFPLQFLEAVNIGSDLNKIKVPFLIFVVESARNHTKNTKSLAAIDKVLVELKKDVIDLDKLKEARAAADAADADADAAAAADAADAADAAAYADAAYAAYAAYAAAADADADAAYAAAAAAYAAYAAAAYADAAAAAAYAAAAAADADAAAAYAAAAAAAAAADADAAAYAAAAAGNNARKNEFSKFADKLLELIKGCT